MIFRILQYPSGIYFLNVRPGIAESILGVLAFAAAILLVISIHETGHAFVALKCGDDTAKRYGRVSLNPMRHLEPIGTLMLLVVGFGWAKPVPVNPYNFNKRNRDTLFVAAAGIVFNLVTAFFITGIVCALVLLGSSNAAFFENNSFWYLLYYLFYYFFVYMMSISVSLALFNLLPFFPLDGYRMLETAVGSQNRFMIFLRRYSMVIIIALLIVGTFTFSPLEWLISTAGNGILDGFFWFWGLLGL